MKRRRLQALILSLSIATALLPHAGLSQTSISRGRVTLARLIAAEKGTAENGNWLGHGRTLSEQRYSPLSQINETNVGRLGLAWSYKLDIDRGTEASPIIVDGVMYTTGAFSIVYALDARNGKLLWKYDPKVARNYAARACCDAVNRGVAVLEGRVYVGTLDGYLVALDARTGRTIWRVDTVLDRLRSYTITGAPRIAAGRIIIGNGGAEFGVRGYVSSYEARTGRLAWRFFTVPGDPAKPFESEAMRVAARTWTGDKWWVYGGGGTVWDSMVYDPNLNLLFIGVGNGSPWNRQYRSPGGGDNLFLSSIIALKADSGEYVWHYQTTPGDSWDYTATQHLILADLTIGGRPRQVIVQAPKNGFFYVIDRRTGELLSAEKYVQVTWATHIDKTTGRPVENPAVTDFSKEPKLIWPSPYGGHNWQPMAFHPGTGLVYIPAQEMPFVMASDPAFKVISLENWNTATVPAGIPEDRLSVNGLLTITGGKLLAWDPVNQREAWRIDQKHPFNGGILATAGNLIFQGTADGHLFAYSADKGKELWQADAQTGVIAPPVTFTVGGEQYLTVMAGWGGALGLVGGEIAKAAGVRSISRVLTYKLSGTAVLPPLAAEPPPVEPPPLTASVEVVNEGRTLYHRNCIFCHGAAAVGGGVIADLRHLDARGHASFDKIVRSGIPSQGMPSFGASLTANNVQAIQAYIIKRAHDEKAERSLSPR
ncbi:MAG: PQQ-dependent dehydrogenase, methanol/ethanol family [Acidobacteriota bacterium]